MGIIYSTERRLLWQLILRVFSMKSGNPVTTGKVPVNPADQLLTAAVAVYDCHAEASVIRRTVYSWYNLHLTNYRVCSLLFMFG